METITPKVVNSKIKVSFSITFTSSCEVLISKDFGREMGLPEKRLLFYFNNDKKLMVNATHKEGFKVIFSSSMVRVSSSRSLVRFMETEKGISKGTRIVFYEEPINGYYVERERMPTIKGRKSATKQPITSNQ